MGTQTQRSGEPRFSTHRSLFAVAIVLGLLNFAVVVNGYGAFWKFGFPLLVLGIVVLALANKPSIKFYLYRVLLLCLASYSGTMLGSFGRRLHSLPLRRSCDQLSELLEQRKAESGQYPDNLEAIPEVKRIAKNHNVTIRQGRFAKVGGIFLETTFEDFSDDPTLYLSSDYFLWLVPVERPLPMSFTKSHVYLKGSGESQWRYENIGWHLAAID